MPRPTPPVPARYPHWTEEKLRVSDTDLNGHVNNTAVAQLCEAGRAELMRAAMGPTESRPFATAVARVAIDYMREAYYPGRVRIGTAVTRVGETSITLEQGLFLEGSDLAIGKSESVLVILDRATRRATALPDSYRAGFSAFAPRN